LQFDCQTALPKPTATTDASGHFHVPKSVTQHAVFLFGGVHNSAPWPDAPAGRFLRIQHPGYATKTLDLHAAFEASGLAKPDRYGSFDILDYEGLVPLGDIPLKR